MASLSSPFRSLIRDELGRQEEANSKNIQLALQLRGLETTVDYVEAHMAHVDSVGSRFKLLDLALRRRRPDGLICEFGVFSGTTVNYLARRTPATIYGFDSFTGLPERWMDGFPAGHFTLKNLPRVRENVRLIKGWFHETLPAFLSEHREALSLLHIDCDLYSSTNTVLTLLRPQIQVGTVIVFDDYFNYPSWEKGEFKAFQDFIRGSSFGYEYLGYNRNDEQVALVITARG